MLKKHILSLVVLALGTLMFIATSPNDKGLGMPAIELVAEAQYPDTFTLNADNPSQIVTVNGSGSYIEGLNFVFTGEHQGNQSATLTLSELNEEADSGMGSETLQAGSATIRGGFGDEVINFSTSIDVDVNWENPLSRTFEINWEGDSQVQFTLNVEAYSHSVAITVTAGESNFSLEVQ